MNTISPLTAMGRAPSTTDAGEAVLASFQLSDRWYKYRFCTCIGAGGACFCAVACLYGLCGGSSRVAEKESFVLEITASAIHFKQKFYGCGCCCQTTVNKSIPLDKVQDVMLISDCCGDPSWWVLLGLSQAEKHFWKVHGASNYGAVMRETLLEARCT